MDMSALSIVINHHNSEIIDGINKNKKIEKIVDNIIDEYIDFISDINFYNEVHREIDFLRRLLNIRPDDQLQKLFVNRYENLTNKYDTLSKHFIQSPDTFDDTTALIQATNSTRLLNYKREMINRLKCSLDKKRQTKCCGKILNSGCHHKHYSFWNMFEDRNNDLTINACKKCRHFWKYDDGLYNCEICNMKWGMFYRLFYQYIVRTADTRAPRKLGGVFFQDNYTLEEKVRCGMRDTTSSNSYLKTLFDEKNELSNTEQDYFEYYKDLTDNEINELVGDMNELIFEMDE